MFETKQHLTCLSVGVNGVIVKHFKTTRVIGYVDCASSSFTGLEIVAAANSLENFKIAANDDIGWKP